MKTIKLKIPENWDNMKEKQLQKVALLFNSSVVNVKFYIKLFFILNDVRWWQFIKKAKLRIVLRNCPLSELQKSYDFIFTENNRTIFPKKIKIDKIDYFPPQNKIANLTVDEFAIIDDLHLRFRETKNLEFLQYMVAVLYRQTKKRPLFDKNDLHEMAEPFKKVPLDKLFAVELAYFGCKNAIVKRFKKAFPAIPAGTPKPKKKYGFSKVILSMAKGDLSKLEAIKSTNVYTFLEQFEEDLNQSKNEKRNA